MKGFSATTGRCLMVMLVFVAALPAAQAQIGPDFDNALGVLPPEAYGPQPPGGPLVVITSPDGYDNFNLGVDFAEPHMTTNPADPLQFFNAFNLNGTHHTEDGHDWATNNPVFPGTSGDPVTGYDNLGNLFYMNMKSPLNGSWVVKSTNNGLTWGAPVTAVNGIDKCWMAVDQTNGPFANYIYATMTASSGGNFNRSTNNGASFTQTFNASTQSLPGMMPAVGPDVLNGHNISGGCVYIVTNGGSTTAETFTFYRSTDGGATFSQMSQQFFAGYVGTFVNGRHSVQNSRTRPYPFIAADNSFGTYRGRLYCVFASNDPPGDGNKPDIWCRFSDDQGVTWSNAVRINDDANPTLHHQWTPAIWCDIETGRLYAKWYDTRLVPTSDSTDVYASYSDDGGVTWAANQRLTTAHFKINCTTCGGGGVPAYQGDYDAITSNSQGAMAVWTDFRFGNFGSFTAYFPDFAMLVSPTSASGDLTGSLDATIDVPSVKLFDEISSFTAEVSPAGPFTFDFPSGNTLNTYPGSLPLTISWTNATEGDYEITITGTGPNGTPIHKRTIDLMLSGTGGIPCTDITSFVGRCVGGGTKTLQFRVNLLNSTIWAGTDVTIDVDGTQYTSTIFTNGIHSRANFEISGVSVGDHTATLIDPDCGLVVHPTCAADGPNAAWDASEALFGDAQFDAATAPASTKVLGNYPNPFNPSTTLRYLLSEDAHVTLKIYNSIGQEVVTLVDGFQVTGSHSAAWDGRNSAGASVASGIYVYRLTAGGIVSSGKMMLMK